jgi:hypothetical protein
LSTLSVFLTESLKDFEKKNPTAWEPRDLELEAEILSQKIALRNQFIKNELKRKI